LIQRQSRSKIVLFYNKVFLTCKG